MKRILYIIFLMLTSTSVFSQEDWRDSLETARSAYKAKQYDKALKYYQSAQKKAPEGIDFSDEMGQSAYKAREFDKAEKLYEQSSSAIGDKNKKSKTFHNIGNCRMEQKNYQGAVDAYKEALRNNPSDEQTRYNLSEAIRRLKDQQDKKNNQNDKNDKNNQQNQNPKKDQSSKDQNKQGDHNKNEGNSSGQNGKGDQQKENNSTLPNKTVDRLLDKLMKEESETKRKVSGNKGEKGEAISGKDW